MFSRPNGLDRERRGCSSEAFCFRKLFRASGAPSLAVCDGSTVASSPTSVETHARATKRGPRSVMPMQRRRPLRASTEHASTGHAQSDFGRRRRGIIDDLADRTHGCAAHRRIQLSAGLDAPTPPHRRRGRGPKPAAHAPTSLSLQGGEADAFGRAHAFSLLVRTDLPGARKCLPHLTDSRSCPCAES
jgi:hypothetical protein